MVHLYLLTACCSFVQGFSPGTFLFTAVSVTVVFVELYDIHADLACCKRADVADIVTFIRGQLWGREV